MIDINNKDYQNNEDYQNFVSKNILTSQTSLVEELLKQEHFLISYDSITNLYKTDEKLKDAGCNDIQNTKDRGEDMNEIFEWWLVDDWMLDKLEEAGEPVLRTEYANWWGRTCTGQAVCMDGVIKRIYEKYN